MGSAFHQLCPRYSGTLTPTAPIRQWETFTFYRVRTEIGKQNSMTFYIFSRIHFFVDSNSPNTAYTQDFFPIRDCRHISASSPMFLPDFSSAKLSLHATFVFAFLDFHFARFHFWLHSIHTTCT